MEFSEAASMSNNSIDYDTAPVNEDRDEVAEIKKLSQAETRRVGTLRLVVTALLVVAGFIVTITTYKLLVAEQYVNFENAFAQFSATIKNSLIRSQEQMRISMRALSQTYTLAATAANATMPFFYFKERTKFFKQQVEAAKVEGFLLIEFVADEEREDWIDHVPTTNCDEDVLNDHLEFFGTDEYFTPGFPSDIFTVGPEGFISSPPKDMYGIPTYRYPPIEGCGPYAAQFDVYSLPNFRPSMEATIILRDEVVFTPVLEYAAGFKGEEKIHRFAHSKLPSQPDIKHPHSFPTFPIMSDFDDPNARVMAILLCNLAWDQGLRFLIPELVNGLIVVGRNTCIGSDKHEEFTYRVDGPDAFFIGHGDLHAPEFDDKKLAFSVDFHTNPNYTKVEGHCYYEFTIYPSAVFKAKYVTKTPAIFSTVVAIMFVVMITTFGVYDLSNQGRYHTLIMKAAQTGELVSSMFPGTLRDKMVNRTKTSGNQKDNNGWNNDTEALIEEDDKTTVAELYLNTTVLFADICGFTAWSSAREPDQVFRLLESIYRGFDTLARKHGVFKVETVGDCYVAVTGFPKAQTDHAIRMIRYGASCLTRFRTLVRQLEMTLGPDTGDLQVRIGIHTGHVVAGVLRGDRARFQLFGDTINVTARVESTGYPGRLHISNATALVCEQAGCGDWLVPRKDLVHAKGKGMMKTFWAQVPSGIAGSRNSGSQSVSSFSGKSMDAANARLVEWNVKNLVKLLAKVVSRRKVVHGTTVSREGAIVTMPALLPGSTFVEEVQEIIELPQFDDNNEDQEVDEDEISTEVVRELRVYVTEISNMYRDNPFHNFHHASHVSMSVMKLMARIVAPSDTDHELKHDSYGITSDPLTQFACAFSALIHDVDHRGVGNPQLIEEQPHLGSIYKKRSVAEQNSLEISWNLLMEDRFATLRATLFASQDDFVRFRQLVVNGVMATDISDKELKGLRNGRWAKAFDKDKENNGELDRDARNRKATIVIEHLIQASDISHTMQHWYIYRKWNELLFEELYAAFKVGRSTSNPADFWAKGEIGFFDFYIIPLAKKLKDCGVFGVSSDEYLNYALANREEWLNRGEEVVAEMVEKFKDNDYFADETRFSNGEVCEI